jgi:hypothetical protein
VWFGPGLFFFFVFFSFLAMSFKKIVCKKLGTNFAECSEIVTNSLKEPASNQVRVKVSACGVNASDINFTSGHYTAGASKLPFDCGFEAIGTVSAVGSDLKSKFSLGDAVIVLKYGCFSEYVYATEKQCFKVPSSDPAYIAMTTSGLTASIALAEVGRIRKGHTVLVTAAAGGTGQFAVQIAKLAGCTVIGTCSSDTKVKYLTSIGCDRAINYKSENLDEVLKKEFPKGIDVIYESVGGSTFETCVNHLAVRGVLIVIGAVSQYQDQSAWDTSKGAGSVAKTPLASALLKKSASVSGFFLLHFAKQLAPHTQKLFQLYETGKIQAGVDEKRWAGLEEVPQAIQWMYDGKNIGKIIVSLANPSKL